MVRTTKITFLIVFFVSMHLETRGQSMNPELGGYVNINLNEAYQMVSSSENIWLIDVRTKEEFDNKSRNKSSNIGKLKGAINIPWSSTFVEDFMAASIPKGDKVVLYCSQSNRSRGAATYLKKNMGYSNVFNILGGLTTWHSYDSEQFPWKNDFILANSKLDFLSPDLICQLSEETVFIDTRKSALLLNPTKQGEIIGIFKNSINIPIREIDAHSDRLPTNKNIPIVVYANNNVAVEVGHDLLERGHINVSVLAGGIFSLMRNKPECYTSRFIEYEVGYKTIYPEEVCDMLDDSNKPLLLDIRGEEEFTMPPSEMHKNDGYLIGAINISSESLMSEAKNLDKNATIIVYGVGSRDSARAADILVKMGFKNVYRMTGGMWGWYNSSLKELKCRDEIGRNLR